MLSRSVSTLLRESGRDVENGSLALSAHCGERQGIGIGRQLFFVRQSADGFERRKRALSFRRRRDPIRDRLA